MLTVGLASLYLALFSSSREEGNRFHWEGHSLNNALEKDAIVLVSMGFNFFKFQIFGVQHPLIKLPKCIKM